jgi:hypothetical protein
MLGTKHLARNDPGTINALRHCGLLKFFKIQGMRAQLMLLEYLVHMWDIDQQVFHVGVHILSLYINDIYFLTGLSCCGSHVTLTGNRGGGLPMSEYVRRYCELGVERHKGRLPSGMSRIYPFRLSFSLSHKLQGVHLLMWISRVTSSMS